MIPIKKSVQIETKTSLDITSGYFNDRAQTDKNDETTSS